MVLHKRAQTDRGDHAVKDDTGAAKHGSGNGLDCADALAEEADQNGDDSRDAQCDRVVVAGDGKNGSVFRIGGVRRAAECAGHHGGEAVAEQSAVQAGILRKVLTHDRAVGVHIPNVLNAGDDRNRGDHANSPQVKGRQNKVRYLQPAAGKTPALFGKRREVHQLFRCPAKLYDK